MGVAKLENHNCGRSNLVFDDIRLYRDTIRAVEKGSARARARHWLGAGIAVLCITSVTYSVISYITIEKMVAAIESEKEVMANRILTDVSKRFDAKLVQLAQEPELLHQEVQAAKQRIVSREVSKAYTSQRARQDGI